MGTTEYIVEGRFYSLSREGEKFAALRVGRDGRIAGTYPEGAILPAGIPRKALPQGTAACVPAFIDTHTHFLSKAAIGALVKVLGRIEGGRFLPDCLDGVRELLEEAAREKPRGPVIGYGLFPGALVERRLPRASELDAWVPGRPVIVLALDGHSSSYSTQAIQALGLESTAREGVLSGEAHDFNMDRVMKYAMKDLGPAQLARGISRAVSEAIDSGLSAVHCLEGFGDSGSEPGTSLLALVGPRLPVRLKLWLQYTKMDRVERYAKKLGNRRVGGCMLWEMDGSISSRTAALDRPYRDRSHAGKLYRTPEETYALCKPFHDSGYQISAHAIGPRGIESILSAYERLLAESGDPRNARRHRIDHFELPRPDQVERAGRLGLVLPVQPGFAWMDEHYLHSYPEALDEETMATFCPLRSILEAGAIPTLSTDAPVQNFDPFIQIAGAVDHPNSREALSVYQALRAYTWAGAYAAFEEDERGTLEVGKYADFAPLDRDPFETPIKELYAIKTLGTWAEGVPLTAPPAKSAGFAASLLRTPRRKI
jgi:predicted amidohydrolase YtcJ